MMQQNGIQSLLKKIPECILAYRIWFYSSVFIIYKHLELSKDSFAELSFTFKAKIQRYNIFARISNDCNNVSSKLLVNLAQFLYSLCKSNYFREIAKHYSTSRMGIKRKKVQYSVCTRPESKFGACKIPLESESERIVLLIYRVFIALNF